MPRLRAFGITTAVISFLILIISCSDPGINDFAPIFTGTEQSTGHPYKQGYHAVYDYKYVSYYQVSDSADFIFDDSATYVVHVYVNSTAEIPPKLIPWQDSGKVVRLDSYVEGTDSFDASWWYLINDNWMKRLATYSSNYFLGILPKNNSNESYINPAELVMPGALSGGDDIHHAVSDTSYYEGGQPLIEFPLNINNSWYLFNEGSWQLKRIVTDQKFISCAMGAVECWELDNEWIIDGEAWDDTWFDYFNNKYGIVKRIIYVGGEVKNADSLHSIDTRYIMTMRNKY